MSDKKNTKLAPYKVNLPDIKPPRTEELADLILRIAEDGRIKTAKFENIVTTPERIQ
jgi:hypothetical protein